MPEVWRKENDNYRIIVWHSVEPLEELLINASLTDEESTELHSFKSDSRRREWLTVRNVVKILLPGPVPVRIVYDSKGKPHLIERGSISISHSHDFIAVMTAPSGKIGVDIEIIHERIETLAQKFINEHEKRIIVHDSRIELLHSIWGAKEVLYKIHGIGDMDFKKHLLVHPFEIKLHGTINASIKKAGFEKDYIVSYEKFKEFMLAWCH